MKAAMSSRSVVCGEVADKHTQCFCSHAQWEEEPTRTARLCGVGLDGHQGGGLPAVRHGWVIGVKGICGTGASEAQGGEGSAFRAYECSGKLIAEPVMRQQKDLI